MEVDIGKDLRSSIYDGMFANMFATLTGGVFLTAFALYLGLDELMIGLLAAMPFMATIFQLPASYFIGKIGERKKIAFWAATGGRLVWVPIGVFALFPGLSSTTKPLFILSLIFSSYGFISISYVSWLSWMSDLVPHGIRGRFFGTRNMLTGAAGMLVLLIYGVLLDLLKNHFSRGVSLGFSVAFLSAVLFGMVSLRFLNRVSDPGDTQFVDTSFRENLWLPLKELNFRRFLIFTFTWSFSVYFASPFFTLYFLRDLRFSYSFVAALGMLSSLADLVGMRLWGKISDEVRNKAIIRLAGWIAVFLPMAWVTVNPQSIFIPIALNLIGGGFWAGINLSMNNLLLKISPQENRPFFLSAYSILGGLGAASGPIVSGLILKSIADVNYHIFSWKVLPLQVIFLTSTLLRFLSLQLFRYVSEPEEATIGDVVRILRGVRGLGVANGFSYLLHPFIEIARKNRET